MELYAINLIKCFFSRPPSRFTAGGYKFLKPFFINCKEYLVAEITGFKPESVITLREPAHRLFIDILDAPDVIQKK